MKSIAITLLVLLVAIGAGAQTPLPSDIQTERPINGSDVRLDMDQLSIGQRAKEIDNPRVTSNADAALPRPGRNVAPPMTVTHPGLAVDRPRPGVPTSGETGLRPPRVGEREPLTRPEIGGRPQPTLVPSAKHCMVCPHCTGCPDAGSVPAAVIQTQSGDLCALSGDSESAACQCQHLSGKAYTACVNNLAKEKEER